jgi:threonine/homoserine/homoserine lactone efflux protein
VTLGFFISGLLIGFSVGAPVGPVGALCLRRFFADGWRVGLAAGMGVATADAIYGAAAGFGITAVLDFLSGQQYWLGLVAGTVLCIMGVRTFLAAPPDLADTDHQASKVAAFFSMLLLTLCNPATIVVFVALFGGLGLDPSDSYWGASKLVLGVFFGSATWWLILSGGMALYPSRLSASWVRAVNRFAGGVILAFGVYALTKSLWLDPRLHRSIGSSGARPAVMTGACHSCRLLPQASAAGTR